MPKFEPEVIAGHPTTILETHAGPEVIYLCAACGSLKQVLFLSTDRWICMACRNEGNEKPTFVPISSP